MVQQIVQQKESTLVWPSARWAREPRILLAAAATDMSVCMLLACACECEMVGEIELQQYFRSMQQARRLATQCNVLQQARRLATQCNVLQRCTPRGCGGGGSIN
jgi:hypothetical protein